MLTDIQREGLRRNGFRFVVRGFYGAWVKWPKRPYNLALETVHKDEVSRDLEVKIFREREDIDEVNVEEL